MKNINKKLIEQEEEIMSERYRWELERNKKGLQILKKINFWGVYPANAIGVIMGIFLFNQWNNECRFNNEVTETLYEKTIIENGQLMSSTTDYQEKIKGLSEIDITMPIILSKENDKYIAQSYKAQFDFMGEEETLSAITNEDLENLFSLFSFNSNGEIEIDLSSLGYSSINSGSKVRGELIEFIDDETRVVNKPLDGNRKGLFQFTFCLIGIGTIRSGWAGFYLIIEKLREAKNNRLEEMIYKEEKAKTLDLKKD